MIREKRSFDNFFSDYALFQRISWDDSINSIDSSALSWFQTTSTDEVDEINSEMMKSNQVQHTISIHEDGQRDDTISIDGSALAFSINGDDEINLGMMMKRNEVQPNISTDLFSDSALFRTASTVDSISIDWFALDVSNNGDDEINSGIMEVLPNISTDGDGGCYTVTRTRRHTHITPANIIPFKPKTVLVQVVELLIDSGALKLSDSRVTLKLIDSGATLKLSDSGATLKLIDMATHISALCAKLLSDCRAALKLFQSGGYWNADAPFQSLEIGRCLNVDAPFQSVEIDRCSNTYAIENNLIQSVESGQCFNGDIFPWATPTPAKYIPLGEIANTAMGNDEMDQGNNIIAVMEAVTNGDYGVDVITHDDIPIEDDCSMKIYNETLEKINQLRGTMPQREAAKKLDVHDSRKNDHFLPSSARLKKIKSVEIGQCSNANVIAKSIPLGDIVMGNDETASCDNEAAMANLSPTRTNGIVLAMESNEINNARIIFTKEVEITLQKINQFRGCTTQEDAAEKLGVSRSTLKRRCKELRLGRWPYSKRKNGLIPSARLKKIKSVEIGQCSNTDNIEDEAAVAMSIPLVNIAMRNDVVTASHENEAAISNSSPMGTNGNVLATGNEEIGHSVNNNARNIVAAAVNYVPMNEGEAVTTGKDTIVVSATYKDDTIEFPLCCSSGIEELRKELDAFETKDKKYKIKYEREDGQWITLLRDTHLSFRIQTLKALGQSNLALSVFDF